MSEVLTAGTVKVAVVWGVGVYRTVVSLYPPVIRSKTYRGYVKPGIILNAIYNAIYVTYIGRFHPL
jgi:hypothetical protein